MTVWSVNPSTGLVMAEFETLTAAEIESALVRSQSAFSRQQTQSFGARARGLVAVADLLMNEIDRWSLMLTEEMGKPFKAAVAEVEKCARVCRYYAQHGEAFLADVQLRSDATSSYVTHLPLGPVLAVMPWNFPFWQIFRFAAPAIMAGNVVVLKHASNVPRCALALQDIFERAGFDPGVFQSLLIEADTVASILKDNRIRAVTVTGSQRAGASVASAAGAHVKKCVLELGGSDAFIVMPSADIERAVEVGVNSRIQNNGQSCIAAKRFIVHRDIYRKFVEAFADRFEALTVGDPVDDATDVGPLAMSRTRARIEQQVVGFLEHGATRVTGGRRLDGDGYFFQPGILTNVPRRAPAYYEELFGPVALMFEVGSCDEAIELANDSRYGLGSSIWTKNEAEAERAILEIAAGATFVNSMVKSDPRLPFGGIRASGYGRELSRQGILEFVNQKTVSVQE